VQIYNFLLLLQVILSKKERQGKGRISAVHNNIIGSGGGQLDSCQCAIVMPLCGESRRRRKGKHNPVQPDFVQVTFHSLSFFACIGYGVSSNASIQFLNPVPEPPTLHYQRLLGYNSTMWRERRGGYG
jgi:hypothetical protein